MCFSILKFKKLKNIKNNIKNNCCLGIYVIFQKTSNYIRYVPILCDIYSILYSHEKHMRNLVASVVETKNKNLTKNTLLKWEKMATKI